MGTRDHRSPVRLVVARLGVACLLLGACGGPSEPGRPDAPPATRDLVDVVVDVVALPTPTTDGSMSLERSLAQRRSVREYRDDQLELALEAGHVAQSLLLQAVALELGAVPIAAFTDRDVQEVLGLPEDHEPLYLVPVGRR